MAKKGLDGYFLKYGITEMDIKIIEDVSQTADIDNEWLEEEILAPYQKRRNSGAKITNESVKSIINRALQEL
jgi:hypothetical protein